MFWSEQVQQLSIKLHDCLCKFDVFFLVSDGVVRLADVLQSENLFFLLNFSSSPCLLDRRAVMLTSCDVLSPLGSRGAVFLPHVLDGGPQSSGNNGILIGWTCMDRCPDRTGQNRCWDKCCVGTNVVLRQMSCWDKCPVGTNVVLGQMSCWDKCRVRTNVMLGQMSC